MIEVIQEQEPTVEITQKEYDELLEQGQWLSALEAAGVDNWQGYDCAVELLEEWQNEDNENRKEK